LKKTIKVCIPGSFDPPTNGHIQLLKRAAELFDEVTVLVSPNAQKNHLLTVEERILLLTDALSGQANVHIECLNGLLAEVAVKNHFSAIVKGVRNASDFTYEYELFEINKSIGMSNYNTAIETVFIPAQKEYIFLSSTMVRELIKYSGDYSEFVPNSVLLKQILDQK